MGRSPWDDDDNKTDNVFNSFKPKKPKLDDFKFPELPKFPGGQIIYIAVAAGLLWLSSGFYKVNEGEEAVITRFGKYVRHAHAGLNYHLPSPIEKVYIEKVNKSRRIEIGYRSNGSANGVAKYITHESTMLTGDENLADLNWDITWHIKDLKEYLFNIASPEEAVRTAAQSAIREVIGETPIASVLSNQKQEIASKIEKLVQATLDQYEAGIQVEMVQLLKAEPPAEVIDAYRDVQTSRADKERDINQALAYNNDILPKARGEAAKLLQEAEGYKRETISKAEGDSKRFSLIYEQYITQKQITKDRLYLDAVTEVLQKNSKYIIGSELLPHMAIGKK